MMRRNVFYKRMRRDIPVIMVGLVLITGFFNGSYNPFSSSLIATTPLDFVLPMEPSPPIGNRSSSPGNRSTLSMASTAGIADATQRPEQNRSSIADEKFKNMTTLRQERTTKEVAGALGRRPDALFHHQPAFFVEGVPPVSGIHCVGETYPLEALNLVNTSSAKPLVNIDTTTPFIYRSCSFQNLCYDVESKEFLLVSSPKSRAAEEIIAVNRSPRFRQIYKSSSWSNNTVSLGPIAQRWTEEERRYFEWFPKIVPQQQIQGYYQLDPSLVLVPLAMHGASNPGHTVWDNFLPIYKLLTMFDLCWKNQNSTSNVNGTVLTTTPLLMEVRTNKFIFGACTRQQKAPCVKMFQKLLPLLGLPKHHFVNKNDAHLQRTATTGTPKASTSTVVCAKAGAAGLGMLSDHATKEHGQYNGDYGFIHNSGKGDLVFQYRNFIMKNMGLHDRTDLPRKRSPYRITVATNSSDDPKRQLTFDKPIHAIQQAFSPDQIVVESYVMRHLSLADQLRVASESFFYLSACGGSVMTATFLPRGASLVLFYANNRFQRLPSFLDYDFLNNLSYIRVHWVSKTLMKKQDFSDLLILLIQQELDSLML